jgi:hypothetical protein
MLTWPERIAHYETVMPHRHAYLTAWPDGWVTGAWSIGNSYRKRNDYYGGYQGDYLKRIAALFPDKRRVLHAFAGMVDTGVLPGDTVDLRADLNPTFVADCQTFDGVPLESYDLVVADPPYGPTHAARYGVPMPDRAKVMRALQRLRTDAHVVWLDQVSPMYQSECFRKEAMILVSGSTNHQFRAVLVFRRV